MMRGAILLVIVSVAFAQKNNGTTNYDEQVNMLSAFVGHWKSVGELFETKYSHAQKLSSEMICEWAPNHQFLISDQIIVSTDGKRDQLGIYGYNPRSKQFYSYAFSGAGGPPYISHPDISGNVWTYSGEFKSLTGTVRTRTTNTFVGRDTVLFETKYSEDGSHWVTMLKGMDIRIK